MKKTITILAALALGTGAWQQTVQASTYLYKPITPASGGVIDVVSGEQYLDDEGLNQLQLYPTGVTLTDLTAIVKDGSGTLILDAKRVIMQQALVVREGTVKLLGGSCLTNNAYTGAERELGASNLIVSGKDAVMYLDNSKYEQGDHSKASSVVVGGRDGDGTLILTNGSALSTSGCFYIGVPSRSVQPDNEWGAASPGTYKTGTTELYRDPSNFEDQYTYSDDGYSIPHKGDVVGGVTVDDTYLYKSQGAVTVSEGSSLGASFFRIYNADITISGEGSLLCDAESYGAFDTPGHYNIIGESDALDNGHFPAKTTINIEQGGEMRLSNYTMFGRYGGDTEINVTGQGSNFTTTSITSFHAEASYFPRSFNMSVTDHATVTMYCFQADPNLKDYPYPGKSNSITIDSTSSFYGSYLYLSARFSVTNEGLMSIDAVPGLTGVYQAGYTVPTIFFLGAQTKLTNKAGAALLVNDEDATFQVMGNLENDGSIVSKAGLQVYNQTGALSGVGSFALPFVQITSEATLYAGDQNSKSGTMTIGGDLYLSNNAKVYSYADGGSLTVQGNIYVQNGIATVNGDLTLTQETSMLQVLGDAAPGNLIIQGSLVAGTLLSNDGEISATDAIEIVQGGVASGTGDYSSHVTVKDGGVVLGGDAATGTGTTNFLAGLTMESGSIMQTSEGNGVSVTGGMLDVAGSISNNGTVSSADGIAVESGGVISGLGTYDASVVVKDGGVVLGGDAATGTGTTNFLAGLTMESGSIMQTSEGNGVSVTGGVLDVAGSISNNGTVSSADGIAVESGGVISGLGTYDASVVVKDGGTMVMGTPDNRMTQMKINGDLLMQDGATIKTYVPFSPEVTGNKNVLENSPEPKVTIDMTDAILVAGRTYTFDFGVEEDQLNLLLPDGISNAVYDTPNPDVFRLTVAAEDMTPEARAGLQYRTPNGAAGSWLMEAIFGAWNPYVTAPTGDVAQALLSMDELTVAGNGQARDSLQAAIAGASAAALGLAYSDDVQRQLRGIRNRALSEIDHPLCPNKRFSAWVQAEGNFRDVDADGTAPGYKLNSWGGTVGAVGRVNDQLQIGLALTAMYGDFDAKSSDYASGDLDISYLTAFATYKSSAWTHYFAAMGSLANADLDRTVSHTRGSYSTSGSTHGIGLAFMYELGYTVELSESTSITPVINVSYSHTLLKGYTESGAGLAMRYGDQEMDAFTLGVGLRAEAEVGKKFINRSVSLNGRVLAKVDVGDRSSSASVTTARPLPVGSTIESNETGAFGVEVGVGVLVPLGPSGGAAFLDGALEARSDYLNWNITAGYRICF